MANEPSDSSGIFPATRWTLIHKIRSPAQAAQASAAIEEICQSYWYPLYVYARRFGLSESDAKDAVQELFSTMLAGNRIAMAEASRGRLRTFLVTALKNVVGHAREKDHAMKRGGGAVPVSLDLADAEGRFVMEVESREASPEVLFDRKWALELIGQAKDKLHAIYAKEKKGKLFEALAPALLDSKEWKGHHEAAAALGMSEGAAKVALHRLRDRFRDVLKEEVRQTLGDDAGDKEVREEVSYLVQLFGA